MWTKFWDMHSGGGAKEKLEEIYIEAPEEEAKIIFYNRFGHRADRVTCPCCGEDYVVESSPSLEDLTAFHRGNMSIDQYKSDPAVLFIPANDISLDERCGNIPEQGYV
jgi:hypothetical protein